MPDKEPTNHEILQAINSFADDTEAHFDKLESRMSSMESEMSSVKSEMSSVKSEMSSVKSEMSSVRSDIDHIQVNMVTKEYLDDKLMDLKSDLVALIRKEDHKVNFFVDVLNKKKMLTNNDKKSILALEPFPKTS